MRLPSFHERLVSIILPVCDRFGLVLAGGYAMKAHGFTDRPSKDLDFATAGETSLPEVAEEVARAFGAVGFRVTMLEVTPRMGRLLITDETTDQTCEFDLLREALQNPPDTCGDIAVVSLEDAVGLKMRALHERSLARDFIDVAAVSHLYPFRELERLARLHNEEFSLNELVMRLEFVDYIADADFAAYGVDEERIHEIRRFAYAWAEDIKLRRSEEGDLDDADFDLPDID